MSTIVSPTTPASPINPAQYRPPATRDGSVTALAWLAAGHRAASRGDGLAALVAYQTARERANAEHAATLEAELGRRIDRLALRLRPPGGAEPPLGDGGLGPAARAWARAVLRLPPPLVLLVLARAHWFLPADAAADRRRAPLARALLAGLEQHRPALDAQLRAWLLTSPLLLASPSIAAESAPILERGLAAYAAGDDLTALHLLVPRLEALLRPLVPAAGRDESGRAPSLVAPGLDGMLRHPPLRRALGEGLAVQLRAVLLAGGLRHRLAHGRLPAAACTHAVTQDVVLCCLRLSRRSVTSPAPMVLPPWA